MHDAFPGAGDALLAAPLDVTDQRQVRAAVGAALERFGRIDVLVNSAGRGLLGAVEEADGAEVRAIFETNVFELLAVSRAVLPIMRRQRSGRIFNVSSVGGIAVGEGWGVYGGTKYAVEGLSEAMRRELAPLGVQVTIVEPGAFRTDFLDGSSLHATQSVLDDYVQTVGPVRNWAAAGNHPADGRPGESREGDRRRRRSSRAAHASALGADCVARVEERLADMYAELNAWRDVAVSTGFDEARA